MAPLVRIAAHLRTILAAHVPLKLVDRCYLRPANHIERNGLVCVATEAPHFEIEVRRVHPPLWMNLVTLHAAGPAPSPGP
jgi:hypothetical protein